MKLCKKKLSTIVNCDVLKLVSITFSKMLFLFIISSLFLPHPVQLCHRKLEFMVLIISKLLLVKQKVLFKQILLLVRMKQHRHRTRTSNFLLILKFPILAHYFQRKVLTEHSKSKGIISEDITSHICNQLQNCDSNRSDAKKIS